MRLSKRILSALLAALMVIAFSACGAPAEETPSTTDDPASEGSTTEDSAEDTSDIMVRLAWIGEGLDKSDMEAALQPYKDETGYGVELIYIPGTWGDYFTKIQTMIAGGEPVDAAYVAIEGFQMFIESGLAQPLTEYAEQNADVYDAVKNDIHPNLLATLEFGENSEQYALPRDWNNVVMHFNTDLLTEAGLEVPAEDWNQQDFLDYCEALTKEEEGIKTYGFAIPDGYFSLEAFLFNFDAQYMNDEMTESEINSANSVEAFQFLQDLVHVYGYSPIPEDGANYIQAMVDGQIAMHTAGRWPSTTYYANEFEAAAVQYLPTFKTNTVITGVGGIFVMADTEVYEAAAALSTFIAGPVFVEDYLSIGGIPALESIAEKVITPEMIPINGDKYYYPSADIVKPVHSPASYPECEDIVMRARAEIIVNGADVQSTLDAAAMEMNSVLAS